VRARGENGVEKSKRSKVTYTAATKSGADVSKGVANNKRGYGIREVRADRIVTHKRIVAGARKC